MKVLRRLVLGHKCQLLRQVERDLAWLSCKEYFARLSLAWAQRKNRQTAKELERRGAL